MAKPALKAAVATGPDPLSMKVDLPAAPEICHDLFEQTCIAFASGASQWGAKVVDAVTASTNNAFEFAGELAAAKSWPEAVAVYTSQARKQFETMAAMTQDFTELNRKLATDMWAPVTSGLPEMLNTIAASRWR
jgi:hypothetical protein